MALNWVQLVSHGLNDSPVPLPGKSNSGLSVDLLRSWVRHHLSRTLNCLVIGENFLHRSDGVSLALVVPHSLEGPKRTLDGFGSLWISDQRVSGSTTSSSAIESDPLNMKPGHIFWQVIFAIDRSQQEGSRAEDAVLTGNGEGLCPSYCCNSHLTGMCLCRYL